LQKKGINKAIHTHLLDLNRDPVLLDIVQSVIIHTLCLDYNDNALCLICNEDTEALYCFKQFLKLFYNKIIVEETDYLLYKHPNNLSVAFYKKIAG
jgi:hypothetical protein